jgi:hypothetical protein
MARPTSQTFVGYNCCQTGAPRTVVTSSIEELAANRTYHDGTALYFLLKAGNLVALADGVPASRIAGYSRAVDLLNQSIFYGLLVGGLLSFVQVVLKIARLIRGQRNTPPLPGVDVKC